MANVIFFDANGKISSTKVKGRGRPPKGAVKQPNGDLHVPFQATNVGNAPSPKTGKKLKKSKEFVVKTPRRERIAEAKKEFYSPSANPVRVKTIDSTMDMHGNPINRTPVVDPLYVQWGHHADILKIAKSGLFFPVFVTGLSGNGKTFMIEQIAAQLKRPWFRVNITTETEEDDLLGGFRLIDGDTVWVDGPVVEALKTPNAMLLLDEIDLGGAALMTLQPVLEGKGVFIKKTNTWIERAPGVQIFATGNTKGRGDDSGKFAGTNMMNEAMLERFAVTMEQPYPDAAIETQILDKVFVDLGIENDNLKGNLIAWVSTIRSAYLEQAIDDMITTRRLVKFAEGYSIFKNELKVIDMITSRFEDHVREAFKDLWKKVSTVETVDPVSVDTEANPVVTDVNAKGYKTPF